VRESSVYYTTPSKVFAVPPIRYNSPMQFTDPTAGILACLPDGVARRATRAFVRRRHPRGTAVFNEGDPPRGAFLLRAGLIKIFKQSPSDRPLAMELARPGEWFGLVAVLDRRPYPATALALEPSETDEISPAVFETLFQGHRVFARAALAALSERVRHAQEMRALANAPVERRVAHVLLRLSPNPGVDVRLRREDVAELAGCIPETAIRVLSQFSKRGLVRTGWKRVAVLDPAALRAIASPQTCPSA